MPSPAPHHWLIKTEPDEFSIDDMRSQKKAAWEGVRNYQARKNLREMRAGDLALFYHSRTNPTGVAGLVRIVKEAYVDPSQFDSASTYYDKKSKAAEPRWSTVDVEFIEAFPRYVTLDEMRSDAALQNLVLLKNTRLSVQPVAAEDFAHILKLAKAQSKTKLSA